MGKSRGTRHLYSRVLRKAEYEPWSLHSPWWWFGQKEEALALISTFHEDTPIIELCLSVHALNCLENAEVGSVGDLLKMPLSELAEHPGIGPKTLEEIAWVQYALSSHYDEDINAIFA